jgi:hypothetical protein
VRHGNGAVAAVVEALINTFMFTYFPNKTKIMQKSNVHFQTDVQNYATTPPSAEVGGAPPSAEAAAASAPVLAARGARRRGKLSFHLPIAPRRR